MPEAFWALFLIGVAFVFIVAREMFNEWYEKNRYVIYKLVSELKEAMCIFSKKKPKLWKDEM